MDPWVQLTGTSAPRGLDGENPHGYDAKVVEAIHNRIDTPEDDVTSGTLLTAFKLGVLFGSAERAAEYALRWSGHLKNTGDQYYVAAHFELPKEGKWNIEAWREAATHHGPRMTLLVQYAGLLPEPLNSIEATQAAILEKHVAAGLGPIDFKVEEKREARVRSHLRSGPERYYGNLETGPEDRGWLAGEGR